MKTWTMALAAAALSFGVTSVASAGTTSANFESSADKSMKNVGSFTGTATYDDAAGLLTITINNTSAASGARLTGLAFNVLGDATAGYRDGDIAGTRVDEDLFDDARAKKGKRFVKAKPIGMFEAGTGINGRFNPPGRKLANRAGIAAGASQTFTFDVAGGAGLTAADFLGGDMGLVAAFRGRKVDKVGSGAVPGTITAPAGGDNSGGDGMLHLPDDLIPPIIPPINIGGGNDLPGTGGNPNIPGDIGAPAAVPLPPAAIPAVATFALLALPALKRKLRELV